MPQVNAVREKHGDHHSWGVLYLDGHTSHRSEKVFRLLNDLRVDFVELLPHSSHIDQPLDLRVYGVWKQQLRRVCHGVIVFLNCLLEVHSHGEGTKAQGLSRTSIFTAGCLLLRTDCGNNSRQHSPWFSCSRFLLFQTQLSHHRTLSIFTRKGSWTPLCCRRG